MIFASIILYLSSVYASASLLKIRPDAEQVQKFHIAAETDNIDMIRQMLSENSNLLDCPNENGIFESDGHFHKFRMDSINQGSPT
jgi:ankyrin repeat protein